MTTPKSETVLDDLAAAVERAGDFNADAEVAPLAMLWPDSAGQWERAMPRLRERLPVLTLGDYLPETMTGPAIWIRALLATREPGDALPVVYLPGVGKDIFRDVEDAPGPIQPLLYLQYRGALFLQPNGKDWTIAAFLQNTRQGLGIKVDGSEATRSALVSALPALLDKRVDDLRSHPGGIDAEYLNGLLISDLPRCILDWIDVPEAMRAGLDEAAWGAFCQQLRGKYRLDPERDGVIEGARMLGIAEPGTHWVDVWARFAESPATWPRIPAMLRGAKPGKTGQRTLFGAVTSHDHWPQDNEAAEDALRQALLALDPNMVGEARAAIGQLETKHEPRRESVWARLGQAPLAEALRHVAVLAQLAAEAFPAGDVAELTARYAEMGWKVDAAALDASRSVTRAADRGAVDAALAAIYTPWLWETAERFQAAMRDQPAPAKSAPFDPPPGSCMVFADGLRYDLGASLAKSLNDSGFRAEITGAVGPLPGVTPSAKPAQSPVAGLLAAGPKLDVRVAETGSTLNQASFKKLLAGVGWVFLASGETGAPDGTQRAWTELGQVDSYGHNHPNDLPRQAYQELHSIKARIAELLEAGWARVIIVTDHGWLLTSRPMPKTDLPLHLTVERKGRCARLTTGATVSVQTIPWCWDPEVAIAVAPGVSCFEDGIRYAHGGLSLQECVVPTIAVTSAAPKRQPATIEAIAWRGLRCVVTVAGNASGLRVDIRQKPGNAMTSLAANVQPVGDDGTARVLIADDTNEGVSAAVVVLDSAGTAIAQRGTIVGGED